MSDLIAENDVGVSNLLLGFIDCAFLPLFCQLAHYVGGVADCQDGIQADASLQFGIRPECACYRSRRRQSCEHCIFFSSKHRVDRAVLGLLQDLGGRIHVMLLAIERMMSMEV